MYYRKAHSLSVRVMPFMLQRKVLSCLRGRKKRQKKNRPLTENCTRDWKRLVNRTNNTRLSPCNYGFHYTTMHFSHAVTTPPSIADAAGAFCPTHQWWHRGGSASTKSMTFYWLFLIYFWKSTSKNSICHFVYAIQKIWVWIMQRLWHKET